MVKSNGMFIGLLKKFTSVFVVILVALIIPSMLVPDQSSSAVSNGGSCVKINDEKIISDHTFASSIDDSGNLYILFQNEIGDDTPQYDLFVSSSTDGGKTFSENVQVNDVDGTTNEVTHGALVAYGDGNVCVAWPDERTERHVNDIYFDKSTDGGATFGTDIRINDYYTRGIWSSPRMDVDGSGNVYVVWHEEDVIGDRIYLTKLSSGASSFSEEIWVNEDVGDYQQWLPDLSVSEDGTIYIVWQNNLDPSTIQFIKSDDGGDSFSEAVEISSSGYDPDNAMIAEHDGKLFVVWHDEHDNYDQDEIIFTRSLDDGETWEDETSIGTTKRDLLKSRPSITVDDAGNIYAAWAEFEEDESSIIIMKSENNGGSWSKISDQDIDASATDPFVVFVETDADNNLYVIWGDGYEGYWDIYVARMESDAIGNEIEKNNEDKESSTFLIIAVPTVLFIAIIFIAVAATEAGRYSLLKFIASPKYSRLKKDDVMNSDIRQRIMFQINTNPGIHFKSIQKNVSLGSGALVYHLGVLEREDYIISRREGFYKRFFSRTEPAGRISTEQYMASAAAPAVNPAAAPLPQMQPQNPGNVTDSIQDRILTVIRIYPGITQTELAPQVGLSVTGVNYHVNVMASAGVIRVQREGKATRLYLVEM
ncbi:MAG: winged helix-turn-helix transcriptional regulator [Thermoplasmata archaeon]|nr:MAG: winged helix-turn-helix transcriptional regulator [Thermoplasmata archaeon]